MKASPATRIDRRTFVRHPCERIVHVLTASGNRTGRLHDLSSKGMGIALAVRLAVGEEITVELERPFELEAVMLAGVVIHIRPTRRRGWFHGCKLSHFLSDENLGDLLELSLASL
jgi:hypothetical protein